MLDKVIPFPKSSPSRSAPCTILVVEDEVLIRMMVADELRRRGFKVIEARNAQEAITVLEGQVPVDLVFTDVRLPGCIDGLTMARLIREMRPDLKVVIASGHLPAAESGAADAFFAKPYNLMQVGTQIEELLGGARR